MKAPIRLSCRESWLKLGWSRTESLDQLSLKALVRSEVPTVNELDAFSAWLEDSAPIPVKFDKTVCDAKPSPSTYADAEHPANQTNRPTLVLHSHNITDKANSEPTLAVTSEQNAHRWARTEARY